MLPKRAAALKAKEKYNRNGRLTNGLHTASADLGLGLDLDLDLDKELIITVSKDTVCQTEVRQAII